MSPFRPTLTESREETESEFDPERESSSSSSSSSSVSEPVFSPPLLLLLLSEAPAKNALTADNRRVE